MPNTCETWHKLGTSLARALWRLGLQTTSLAQAWHKPQLGEVCAKVPPPYGGGTLAQTPMGRNFCWHKLGTNPPDGGLPGATRTQAAAPAAPAAGGGRYGYAFRHRPTFCLHPSCGCGLDGVGAGIQRLRVDHGRPPGAREGGAMKRWVVGWALGLATLVVMLAPGASSVFAAGTDVVWLTRQIPWASKTTPFTGSARDTAYITDEADTTRTAVISTGDWAWDAIAGSGAATGAQTVALLTVTAEVNNGTADSLYFHIEQGVRGRFNHNVPGAAAFAPALGNYLVKLGNAGNTKIVFQGPILGDPDLLPTVGNVWLIPEFRIVLRGDVTGTAPKLSQCRAFITYPSRRASQ